METESFQSGPNQVCGEAALTSKARDESSGAETLRHGCGDGGSEVTLKSGQVSFLSGRVLVWFSCGAASAVALKLAVEKYGRAGVVPLYCGITQEHSDNARFKADVERWLGVTVETLVSEKYGTDIYEVFRRERFIAGRDGARCTRCLKKDVRKAYQWEEDTHVFGYTVDERARVAAFERDNPVFCDWLLVDAGITKADCYRIIQEAGIVLPMMYRLGYRNNNCIGCVKGGAGYWNKIRRDFPDAFEKMANFSRELGVRLVKVNGERVFLADLPPDAGRYQEEPDFECGPQCVLPSEDAIEDFAAEIDERASRSATLQTGGNEVERKFPRSEQRTTTGVAAGRSLAESAAEKEPELGQAPVIGPAFGSHKLPAGGLDDQAASRSPNGAEGRPQASEASVWADGALSNGGRATTQDE